MKVAAGDALAHNDEFGFGRVYACDVRAQLCGELRRHTCSAAHIQQARPSPHVRLVQDNVVHRQIAFFPSGLPSSVPVRPRAGPVLVLIPWCFLLVTCPLAQAFRLAGKHPQHRFPPADRGMKFIGAGGAQGDAQLAEMQVKAPSDCVLEVLSVKAGDVLAANREVATLLLPQHLWVRVYVPEPWLGLIKIGDHVRVRVDSFRGKDFDGIVEQVNRQAEFTPRNVQTVEDRVRQVFGVKIRLPSGDDRLRAGMAADVYFPNVK